MNWRNILLKLTLYNTRIKQKNNTELESQRLILSDHTIEPLMVGGKKNKGLFNETTETW